MTLKDRIVEDMKSAMRAKAADRLGTIRLLLAAIKQREVDDRIVLDDAAVVAVIDKLIKQRKDSVAAFQAAGRTDLVDKESAEIGVLMEYVPARLSPEDIVAAVSDIINQLGGAQTLGPADMGKVMAAAKEQLAGKAEMGQVSAAVKAALAR